MIIRILGDGQYDMGDTLGAEFDALDDALVGHVEAGDEDAYHRDLAALIELVRSTGSELPHDELAPSDLVLPDPSASLEEVRALLAEHAEEAQPTA
ncbi:MAG TPA: hypothetical protein VFW71_05020 [Actinomycetota bacterium]|nr:hypothetical protein [Actinomycetota bacterium]